MFQDTYTFDTIRNNSSRTVMGLLEMLGNIGGVQQILVVIFTFFMSQFNELSFNISVINLFYSAKTKDISFASLKENKLVIGFCDKLRLLTNIFPNKKMKRFLEKGNKRLD